MTILFSRPLAVAFGMATALGAFALLRSGPAAAADYEASPVGEVLLPGGGGFDIIATDDNALWFFGNAALISRPLPNSTEEAFRWTPAAGIQPLGGLPGGSARPENRVNAVSAGGVVAVGRSDSGRALDEAFRWTAAGGMTGLGFIADWAGAEASEAHGVSADGRVVVGVSTDGRGRNQAFRWTAAGGMTGLGFVGAADPAGGRSIALAASADGSVVVGGSVGGTGAPIPGEQAFRWSAATGMVGLGLLPGRTPSARDSTRAAYVSADGAIVFGAGVYEVANLSSVTYAFRWTASSGIVELGHLNTALTDQLTSIRAVSGDSQVVFGTAYSAPGVLQYFRWTASGGMTGLGQAGIDVALGEGAMTNRTGSILLGNIGGANPYVARWTAATGLRDVRSILSANAVTLPANLQLGALGGMSPSGEFFVLGGLPQGGTRITMYLVRIRDAAIAPPAADPPTPEPPTPEPPTPEPPAPEPPIAGLTTYESVLGSVNQLAEARGDLMSARHAPGALMLGDDLPVGTRSYAGVFAAAGSVEAGAIGRLVYENGVSIRGGAGYSAAALGAADLQDSALFALALRYVANDGGAWRPLAELGGWLSSDATIAFTRVYANGEGTASGAGISSADLSYLYGRLGIVYAPEESGEIAVWAEYGRQRLKTSGYAEAMSAGNPFEARLRAASDEMSVVKVRVQWTGAIAARMDLTLSAALARGFGRNTSLVADVAGLGSVAPDTVDTPAWAEYGARLGYAVTDQLTVDAFVSGTAGLDGARSHVHGGIAIRFQF